MQDGPNGFEARWNEEANEKDARERHAQFAAYQGMNRHERRAEAKEEAKRLRRAMRDLMEKQNV